ncbi:DUF4011 domain-containing protein [Enterobacter kobei]|uniref:DUF4011 domain-containing anti-phage protein Hhe n=1 Tax=Enterobacter kobei TaxID=208224 RepID=UPI001C63BA62|nr:DUF4011 domain-containing anti-phage protein Hhe [Enterobacter kobei]MBW7591747.1 DUF4011 domain-containing protein [Enterobacter kobei]
MSTVDTSTAEELNQGGSDFILTSLEAMRKKLLDLTSRNRLLNFPITQKGSSLRIVDELPEQLYETLCSEIPMEFAPVPDPTRAQLLEHGYLKVGPDGKDIQLRAHPSAKDWAHVLGIRTDFDLPDSHKTVVSDSDRELLEKAHQFILQYAQGQNGKLTGIRSEYVNQGIALSALKEACCLAGYEGLEDFERQAKAGNEISISSSNPSHDDNRIQALLYPNELEACLRAIYGKAQTALEESGANILYLALGFLEWYESDSSEKARYAPLFTIPVRCERGKLDPKDGLYKFQLYYTGEDILPNLSLKEKLQADFGLALPLFNEEETPESYFASVKKVVEQHKPKWSVKRYGALSLLNFGKMMMYLDLDPARWPCDKRNILSHEVIRRFFTSQSCGQENSGLPGGFGQHEYCIDSYPDIHDKVPLIDDADSSQHSALIDAIRGQNLVIEGPPGSGKSQTITNLIAAALLNGKKVLFVAEKMAALEVVKRRLDRAGLGQFCLELHSHKTHKRKVLDDINARLVSQATMPTMEEIDAQILRYEDLKQQLNEYAALINNQWAQTGKTIHQILSGATRYRHKLDIDATALHIENLSGKQLDKVTQLRLRDQIVEFSRIYKEVREQVGANAEIYEHPWSGVNNTQIQLFDSARIVDLLQTWQTSIIDFQHSYQEYVDKWALEGESLNTLQYIEQLVEDQSNLPVLCGSEHFPALSELDSPDAIARVRHYLDRFELLQGHYVALSQVIEPQKLRLLEQGQSCDFPREELEKYGAAEDFTLRDLVRWLESIQSIHDELSSIYAQLNDFKNALPDGIASYIDDSQAGLLFCSELLSILGALPTELIRVRDPLFDDDDIDAVLRDLMCQIETLRPLRDGLSTLYQLDQLPSQEMLAHAVAVIQQGGLFAWFKSDWRSAKALLMAQSRKPDTKFAELKRCSADLLKYSELLQRFEQSDFGNQLGNAFRGLDTDCEQLMLLRDWYKKVRACYGIGFGKRVAIGSGLFNLDGEIIKGVHLIEKSQISSRLMTLVKRVEHEAKLLPRISSLLEEHASWLGEQGVLMQSYRQVRNTLIALQGWFINPDISLEQMTHSSEILQNINDLQISLENDSLQLGAFLQLTPLACGAYKNNQLTLDTINDTLNFAEQLVDKINCVSLATQIRHLASGSDYDLLCRDGGEIVSKWNEQIKNAELYALETKLERSQWLKSTDGSLNTLIERNERAIQQPRWLNGWVNFIRCYEQMHENGLQRIWSAVLAGSLPIEKVELGLALAIYDQLAREVIHIHPELMRVSGSQRNALQKSFKDYDKKLIELQRQRIAAKIACRNIPEGNSGGKKSEYTELALIKNELGKKTRHIPIRQLVNRACNALVAIKPCFMMGPMSAAHYLEPGRMEFDLVVMDEASQVKPEDALGVIARGKQLVVVGDPKQLPPTSFFDRSADGEDDDDAAALSDTDSILDAALPLFPMRRLRWHYRSRHEKLIAYSNRHFYNSDLVIFPSPNAESPEYGIKFTYVSKGRFSNQHNIEEAQAVAEAVLHHAQHRPGESLGVVAMSSKQRDQIERAIDELRRNRPEFNDAIDGLYAMEEPLFVKNLENVQGDERDVIFISFTYGPSEHGGKVYQRFGPINSDVGWRRLNVLFTRSKKRMHVFSSMRSEDVLTSETSKLGVISLKGFLQFAESGKLDSLTTHTGRAPDSDFEVAVMEALNHAGFECEPQVGVAGFFIDLAVKDPGCPGRYLMGIECDGAAYHSAKSARDRDRLRQEVLERLGWRISRIWSTDWFSNPDEVLSPIIRKLHELKTLAPDVVVPSYEYVETIESSAEVASDSIDSLMPNLGLKEQLKYFATHVIEVELPNVDADRRLLRPAMLEALLEHQPLSRSEFVERIPHYLRQATDVYEAQRFLDRVLALIDGAEAEANDAAFESELA